MVWKVKVWFKIYKTVVMEIAVLGLFASAWITVVTLLDIVLSDAFALIVVLSIAFSSPWLQLEAFVSVLSLETAKSMTT